MLDVIDPPLMVSESFLMVLDDLGVLDGAGGQLFHQWIQLVQPFLVPAKTLLLNLSPFGAQLLGNGVIIHGSHRLSKEYQVCLIA